MSYEHLSSNLLLVQFLYQYKRFPCEPSVIDQAVASYEATQSTLMIQLKEIVQG